jgi:hypothetical protein
MNVRRAFIIILPIILILTCFTIYYKTSQDSQDLQKPLVIEMPLNPQMRDVTAELFNQLKLLQDFVKSGFATITSEMSSMKEQISLLVKDRGRGAMQLLYSSTLIIRFATEDMANRSSCTGAHFHFDDKYHALTSSHCLFGGAPNTTLRPYNITNINGDTFEFDFTRKIMLTDLRSGRSLPDIALIPLKPNRRVVALNLSESEASLARIYLAFHCMVVRETRSSVTLNQYPDTI